MARRSGVTYPAARHAALTSAVMIATRIVDKHTATGLLIANAQKKKMAKKTPKICYLNKIYLDNMTTTTSFVVLSALG